ncbi:MAG: aminotransferase class V-fold PLP-dependent enzyme [Cytophagia bacterium]|nr:MAG: aminotransferase class V-fold PLP-dependent enzyme [Runella slithyformis]TAG18207.1 MAG: aminotransferase class V-fold PLP-dependent enzyme [Cytophagales bacterium]TAG37732.1 MAG: aminotransferase class V-fold PLP-dependent enzyme [Cytophagia bacterium]TAF00456.1 MAG: aminotransferase class V-fold PLP-dependent enzyme [Runella slithyformis]TAF49272.1 MAG: aminotransferase class V-fold PLP-dependent enzyme [Runella slithyformis]
MSIQSLFNLPADVHFINCATRGPFSKAVEQAGIAAIQDFTPHIHQIKPDDFFDHAWVVRQLFSELIHHSDAARIAVIPSVSYGMAVVAQNLHRKPNLRAGQHILLVGNEFPSDVYAWERVCKTLGLHIKTIEVPDATTAISEAWNTRLLEAINADTALVVAPHVHWQLGVKFDLEAISRQAKKVGALLAVDGTQSVGALDFDLQKIQPDALICVAYKWLMGPYSMGLAYFGPFFDDGVPLEETWMGRQGSNVFAKLTDYQSVYQPKAYRYNVGEHSHFIQMPMLEVALRQKLEWTPAHIQAHCHQLWTGILPQLKAKGIELEPEAERAHHLIGLRLPAGTDALKVQQQLAENRVIVAARGQSIRVSPHLYNSPQDMAALVEAL